MWALLKDPMVRRAKKQLSRVLEPGEEIVAHDMADVETVGPRRVVVLTDRSIYMVQVAGFGTREAVRIDYEDVAGCRVRGERTVELRTRSGTDLLLHLIGEPTTDLAAMIAQRSDFRG